ncbi:hypothetical protein FRB90_011213 [Tulasnella sp. 427]|nr:hypothetical protein FRB90_011213 [Tulasnella sp. 427]
MAHVKKDVRGYEFDKKVTQSKFKGFDKLPKQDQDRVVKTFEFNKPFDEVSFRKKPDIDWHDEKQEIDELARSAPTSAVSASASTSTLAGPSQADRARDDEDDAEAGREEDSGPWTEARPHCRGSTQSGSFPYYQSSPTYHLCSSDSSSRPESRISNRSQGFQPVIMPSKSNTWKNLNGKARKTKPNRNTLEYRAAKVQSPQLGVEESWNDAAPSWGDTAPSWGDDEDITPASNSQPTSDRTRDHPTVEADPVPGDTQGADGWGTEEWTYPGTEERAEEVADEAHGRHTSEYQLNSNEEDSGWGNGEWANWGAEADEYHDRHYDQQQYDQAYYGQQYSHSFSGGYESWVPSSNPQVPASWEEGAEEEEVIILMDDDAPPQPPSPTSAFKLNPTASVFVPKNFAPPSVPAQEPIQADSSPSAVYARSSGPSAGATPYITTPSLASHSSPFESRATSTPATGSSDVDPDITEERRCRADLEIAELKLGISQAELEVRRNRLLVAEKKRALLGAKVRARNNKSLE